MSSKENSLKNLMKKAMVTSAMTSTAALMLIAESSFGGSLVNRNIITPNADLGSGAGLDNNAPFDPASVLTFLGNYNVNANVTSIAGMYIPQAQDASQYMTFPNNIVLGSILPPARNLADRSLNMRINDGVNVTLDGTIPDSSLYPTAKDAAGAGNPFAPALDVSGGNPVDTYFINSIDFQAGTGTLNVNTADKGGIALAAATATTKIANAADATLNVMTDLQVRSTTWTTIGNINISDNTTYSLITDDTTNVNIQPIGNKLNFLGVNSTFASSCESGSPVNPVAFTSDSPILSGADGIGIVKLRASTGATTVSADMGIANTERLNTFNINGDNTATITSNIYAQNITIALVPNNFPPGTTTLTWTTPIDTSDGKGNNGLIKYTTDTVAEFQQLITSDMDFAGTSGTAIIDNGVYIDGSVDNSIGGGASVLQFQGSSAVSGNVGFTNAIPTININGDKTTKVSFMGTTTTQVGNFVFNNTGQAAVGSLTATGGVNFNGNAATLIFGAGKAINFSSSISNAGNATIIVDVTPALTATDASFVTAKSIQIGKTGPSQLTLAINEANLNLLANGAQIIFNKTNSTLAIAPPIAQTVTFSDNIDGFADNTSNITLVGTQPLIIQGATGVETIGANTTLNNLNITGTVTAAGGANLINIAGFKSLTINGNSSFVDQGVTSSTIQSIIIGDNTGASAYVLSPTADFNIATAGMKFGNLTSIVSIESNADVTATMNGSLDPGAAGNGIVQLVSKNGTLTLTGVPGTSLGIAGAGNNLLNSMVFLGTSNITVTPDINTANSISTGITGALTLNNVNTGINFTAATNLTVNNVTGQIDLAGNAGTVNVNAGGVVTDITSSNGVVGAVILGNGVTTGDIINIATVDYNGAGTSNSIQGATTVNFNNPGLVVLANASQAETFNINGGGIRVEDPNGLSGTVNVGDGEAIANVKGDVFVGQGMSQGNIDGNVTITADGNINTTKVTSITITGTATYNGVGTINATTIGGQVDFADNGGTLNVNDTGNLTTGVTSNGGTNGTVNFLGNATSGAITNVAAVNFAGIVGQVVTLTNPSSATDFTITAGGTVNAPQGVTATGIVAANNGIFTANVINGDASVNAGQIR